MTKSLMSSSPLVPVLDELSKLPDLAAYRCPSRSIKDWLVSLILGPLSPWPSLGFEEELY